MSAIISDCGAYRYVLKRELRSMSATRDPVLFIMLNPSVADEDIDDPTIRRCKGFAESWGCSGIVVANLYALRSTDHSTLWRSADPVGPENDTHLAQLAIQHEMIVCAWGGYARPDRVKLVRRILACSPHQLWCLGVTKNGAPRHPLFVHSDTPLVPWPIV